MRASEVWSIVPGPEDDWFDPHLTIDTRLFLDPLLILEDEAGWGDAHDELIAHFTHCYDLVARATGASSVSAQTARALLTFPEPFEFGLGYTTSSTRGSGSGAGVARQIADGIAVATAAGLTRPEHIEEIGILNKGFGADRVSDAVANVLKRRFITYTQEMARRHGVPLALHRVRNARVALGAGRWVEEVVELPTNPETGGPIVLVPRRFLRELPTLNAEDWFQANINEDVRRQMNIQVGQTVNKTMIVRIAREHPERVRQWAREQTSRPDLQGYDFDGDPLGVVQWDQAPAQFAANHPLEITKVSTQQDLVRMIEEVLEHFRHFIEDQRGWALLWNDDKSEKPELAAQLVFLGIAQHYLRLFGVEVDREVELGRGPVDFKTTAGAGLRALIEVKKVHNGKFWHGLETQLVSYLTSDRTEEGWYVAIRYRDAKSSETRVHDLPAIVREAARTAGLRLHHTVVDARPKESASHQ